MEDVDGNRYVDFDMGFGALFAGHCHPMVRAAVEAQLDDGTLFVTPCEANAEVAELLAERYGLPMWRFTNSGTEATMDAIRVARGVTGRDKIVKVEGGYHGHHDEVMISMKPPLDEAGPADAPHAGPGHGGHHPGGARPTPSSSRTTTPRRSSGCSQRGDVACFIVEPVMENIGICLPAARLPAKRCGRSRARYGTLLIFDEVKTGITAGWGGATGAARRRSPTSCTLAKSHRRRPADRRVRRHGRSTWTRSPRARCCTSAPTTATRSCMAAAKAVLAEVCTPEATQAAIDRNRRLLDACDAHHRRRRPAGPHRPVRRQGLRHVVARARPQLPRLQGHRLRPRLRPVDAGHQPRRPAAARPRRAVAHLGAARRRRRRARRRRVRASSWTRSSPDAAASAVRLLAAAAARLSGRSIRRRCAGGPGARRRPGSASPAPTSTTVTAIEHRLLVVRRCRGTTASHGSLDERGDGAHGYEVAHGHRAAPPPRGSRRR